MKTDKPTFNLVKNDYVNSGLCVYEDSYGNRLQMFREKSNDGSVWLNNFTAKLRFKNKNVRADSLKISLPLKDEGTNLHLDFKDKVDRSHNPDVLSAISMITEIIQRWIAMSNDIALLNTPNELIKKNNPLWADDEINKHKMLMLSEYPELQELITSVMRVGDSSTLISHT